MFLRKCDSYILIICSFSCFIFILVSSFTKNFTKTRIVLTILSLCSQKETLPFINFCQWCCINIFQLLNINCFHFIIYIDLCKQPKSKFVIFLVV